MDKIYPKKYRIDEYVERRSATTGEARANIHAEIRALLGISRVQFWRVREYRVNQRSAMNSDQLIALAQFFGCDVTDLLNVESSVAT